MAKGYIYEIWDPSAKQVYIGQTHAGITNTSFYNRLSAHAAAACGFNIYSKGKGSFAEPTNSADILMSTVGIENCHYVVHEDRSTVYGLDSVVNDLVDLGFFYQRNGQQGDLDIGEILYSCGHLLIGDTLLNKDAGAGSTWYYEPALSKWGRDFVMALNENEGLDIGINEVMANRTGKGADKYSTITHKSVNTILDMLEHPTRSKSCANNINYFFAKCTVAILARFFMNNFAKLIADPDNFQKECKDYVNGIYKKYAQTFNWSVQVDWVKKFNIENFKRRVAKQPLPKRVLKNGAIINVDSYSLWSNHTKKIIIKCLADWMRSEKATISCTYTLSYQQDNSIWEDKLKNIIQFSGDASARYQDDMNNDPGIQAAIGRGLMWVVYSGIENYQTLSTLTGHALYGDGTVVAINKEGPTYSSQLKEWLRNHAKLPMALIGINWHIVYSIAIQTYRKKHNLVIEKATRLATNGIENTYYFAGLAAKQALYKEHYLKDNRHTMPYAAVGAYSYFTRKRKSIDYWDKIAKSYPDAADDIDLFDGKRIWTLMKGQ